MEYLIQLGIFQSTPSTRRETGWRRTGLRCTDISIHSLHTEGDNGGFSEIVSQYNFNPLPPHGGRLFETSGTRGTVYFNPLPPHGGRRIFANWVYSLIHFNPLPPHGGRPGSYSHKHDAKHISIHSLHTEGDEYIRAVIPRSRHFNPLPPHGGRPFLSIYNTSHLFISIHSLHTEGDHRRDRLS